MELFLVGIALAALTALVYVVVGRRVASRALAGEARLANRMFGFWWISLGIITAVSAGINLAAAGGFTQLHVHVGLTVVMIFLLCMALWALAYYLLYLFTGRRGLFAPLGLFYTGYFVVLMVLVWNAHPIAVQVGDWSATLTYERDLVPGGSNLWLLILLLAPQFIGGLAYFSLFFKVDDRSQRYRIAAIGGAIVFWFGVSILATAIGWNEAAAWPLVSRALGLAAALIIYSAFEPPRAFRRRFGLQPLSVVLMEKEREDRPYNGSDKVARPSRPDVVYAPC